MPDLTEFEINLHTWLGTTIAIIVALVIGTLIILFVRIVSQTAGRRSPWIPALLMRMRHRWRVFILLIVVWMACAFSAPADQVWWPILARAFLIATIITGSWLLSAMATFGIERLIARYGEEVDVGSEIRRKRTQLTMLRRLANVLIAVIAIGAVLFTFPEVRAVGTSVLASAGIVSVIAGLAAQSTLSNLFAGIQIAFSNAVRVGDVVVIEGEWGTIGEITLSYVVVHIWDERRLVIPCTYFTSKPYESWTRSSPEVLGTVYLDLDWRVPVEAMRDEFNRIMEDSPEWDRRAANVLVTDAKNGHITVRLLVSAANSDAQWVLRCRVREGIVTWLQREHPEALPVTRVSLEQPEATAEA